MGPALPTLISSGTAPEYVTVVITTGSTDTDRLIGVAFEGVMATGRCSRTDGTKARLRRIPISRITHTLQATVTWAPDREDDRECGGYERNAHTMEH